ncbi:TPA: hypothetical protein ACOQZT_001088 [Serratia odorifera]
MLKRLKHRLLIMLSTLLFVGCLHSARLDEARMSSTLQPALSALSSNMQDIREALSRCARDDEEESSLYDGALATEARISGSDDEAERQR